MVTNILPEPCWRGNVDLSELADIDVDCFKDLHQIFQNGLLEG
jgi:hypothetical protein